MPEGQMKGKAMADEDFEAFEEVVLFGVDDPSAPDRDPREPGGVTVATK